MAKIAVAPLVGAWIEIPALAALPPIHCVAPLVGAWIEISHEWQQDDGIRVAPLVGAWIEMIVTWQIKLVRYGRSPRGSVD